MRSRLFFFIAIACLCARISGAANVSAQERTVRELPIEVGGSFWLNNPLGSIDIMGLDTSAPLSVTAIKTIVAADRGALNEARDQCVVSFEGSDKVRLVRTLIAPMRNAQCSVAYSVRLPRSVDLKLAGKSGDIRIRNVSGSVTVNTFIGVVSLVGVVGASAVDIVNGRVVYDFPRTPSSNVQVQAVNADIDVYLPPESNFDWIADTLKGDLLTTLPTRGIFAGTVYRGHVNAPGGPVLTTDSLMGRIRILAKGSDRPTISVRNAPATESEPNNPMLKPAQTMQVPIVGGAFRFAASVSNVSVGEVRGPATVQTGAGEIQLGVVYGDCNVVTLGGPLNLGDILGTLVARTGAGDILVRAAREGGNIWSGGGIIRVLYTGGPTTIQSGGGDIIVRQAAGPINAQTPSGDITITLDPNHKTQRVEARTGKGSVVINASPRFAADIDATVITSDPDANAIQSDFSNLSIRKEQVGGRTRIHATGKINGGGDRLELYAEEGDIHLTSQSTAPVTLMTPKP